ncbi:MAG: glyoxalase [Rhodospirillaceae bacterium]|nr:MAG: glyoxalase [Rhodospirillaceae bacterium]
MIIGIERLIYGVENVAESTRYFADFGLPLVEQADDSSLFILPEGSRIELLRLDSPRLPKSDLIGQGVRELVWGCNSQQSVDALVANLKTDREVRVDERGVAHFVADGGVAMGLVQFTRAPVVFAPDPVNAPFNTQRLNQTRKWRRRCFPKNIQHVVFGVKDHEAAGRFLCKRLGFRLSDVMRDYGVFLRCEGNNDHHQIFYAEADAKLEGLDGQPRFHHANFGVEDLDELMIGINYMERCGWPKSSVGLGRHRLSSGLFCYLPCPAGGQAEYGTDFDALDDNWIPRIYEIKFSFSVWLSVLPPFLMDEPAWDWCYHPDYLPGASKPVTRSALKK